MQELFDHQRKAAEFIEAHRGVGALFMDMGTGKTRTAIEIYKRLRERSVRPLKMIVICPLSLIEAAWGEDIKRFAPDMQYWNMRDQDYKKEWDIAIINYEGLLSDVKRNLVATLITKNMLVIDESSRMKNHKSKTTKTLMEFSNRPIFKIIMSGTPAPNTPLEYWAQMEFLRPGMLHPSFFGFRNTYFHLQRGGQVMSLAGQRVSRELMRSIMTKGWKYEITPANMQKLMNKINPVVFWAKKEDCLDLPDEIDEVRTVELGAVQRKHYRELKNQLITEIKGHAITAQAALTKAMKLREITSGFAFTPAGEVVDLGEAPKISELEGIVDEAGARQIIIWAVFRWDIERICQFIGEKYAQDGFRTLYSGTDDAEASIADFKAGKARFLVANPASAAHGLTLVNCNLQIFYSLDYSWERYVQSKARIHRAGQVNKCTYIHVLAKDTIDEDIYKILQRKGDMNEISYQLMRS